MESCLGMTAGKHLKNVLGGNFCCFCFDMAQNWVIPEGDLPIGSGYPVNDTPSALNFKTETNREKKTEREADSPRSEGVHERVSIFEFQCVAQSRRPLLGVGFVLPSCFQAIYIYSN